MEREGCLNCSESAKIQADLLHRWAEAYRDDNKQELTLIEQSLEKYHRDRVSFILGRCPKSSCRNKGLF